VLYDLRHSDLRVRWLVTLLLATLGTSYLFGAWMVGLYAGFSPRKVAETYGPRARRRWRCRCRRIPRSWPSVPSRWPSMGGAPSRGSGSTHQDTHVHMPMYAVIAACLSVSRSRLALPRWAGLSIIALLFAAPWLDFAGMWLTKLARPALRS